MKRFLYELSESWKIAVAQMRSNKTRSTLTALGVVIGIVAVTLMGTAIGGIQVGFFNDVESRGGANVCVIGYDVADALFPSESPIEKSVLINGQPFRVVGVISRQGTFLGLFSLDSIVVMPLPAFQKYFSAKSDSDILVKVKDKTRLAEATDELTGVMRRVRGLPPEKKDDFSINEQQALKSTLDPIKNSIAIAGLFVTGLSLFVGAIGIMNITFVSVKERTREIGTRKALGARRRTILLQFLIESTSLCLLGGFIGLGAAYVMCTGIGQAFPSFPIRFSLGLVLVSMAVSILTGLFSGFAPAWSASRLDPVAALRFE